MNKTEPTLECADFTAAFVRILTENGLAEFDEDNIIIILCQYKQYKC